MCGIAGALDLARSSSKDELRERATAMASTLRHRGPDDEGVWVDPAAGVALGFRRLAIIDLTADGAQPMVSADERFVLVFNGEIYNFPELRRELEATGVRFRGRSDTEVLVEAIAAWGLERALACSNGMFAFAVWDRAERALFLARDRLGEKPLYYGSSGGHVFFASELKALHAHPAFSADLDRDALTLYLRFGYVPAPHCVYEGFAKLPPGTYVKVHDGRVGEPVQYWSAAAVAEAGVSSRDGGIDPDALDELETLLLDAVGLRMVADVPLGALLSGGIDSSLVVALMQARSPRPVRTFSIGFREPEFDESAEARAVAAHLGTDHNELTVSADDALALVPRLPHVYDEPHADSSQLPTMLVTELARRHVTVALSGDGGDEVFAGYSRYLMHEAIWRRVGWLPSGIRSGLASLATAVPTRGWDRAFGLLPSSWAQSRAGDKVHKLAGVLDARDPVELYRRLMSHWDDPAGVVIGGGEPPTPLSDHRLRPALGDFTDQMMYLDTVTYLPDDILVKVDRASMAASLEVRVPFLDHRVVEFAWRLPQDLKLRGAVGKWALRQVLHRHVPAQLVERPKMGFGVPLAEWLRGPLRGWAEELLNEGRLREQGLLRPEPIRRRWSEHLSGKRDWKYDLWDVLVLQAWLDAHRTVHAAGAAA